MGVLVELRSIRVGVRAVLLRSLGLAYAMNAPLMYGVSSPLLCGLRGFCVLGVFLTVVEVNLD